MPTHERSTGSGPSPDEPLHSIALPPRPGRRSQGPGARGALPRLGRGHGAGRHGALARVGYAAGVVSIALTHERYDHPRSPVIRSLLTFFDRPRTPLRLVTFTNVADAEQHALFAALAEQEALLLLCYDELLHHRLSKRVRNATAGEIPRIVATASRLLAAVPPARRDFDQAKADVWEVTSL